MNFNISTKLALSSVLILGLSMAAFAQEPTTETPAEHTAPATAAENPSAAAPTDAAGTTAHEPGAHTAGADAGHQASDAHAAGGEGHHAVTIPMSVTFQVINFVLFLGLLVYFLRKPIIGFFRSREEMYSAAVQRGELARIEAEKKRREIQDRLTALESSTQKSLENARAEAAGLMSQFTNDAKELSDRLKREATRTAEIEVERAKHMLREEMLAQSVTLSQKILSDKMAEGDQKRLQTEFVDKIQEVR